MNIYSQELLGPGKTDYYYLLWLAQKQVLNVRTIYAINTIQPAQARAMDRHPSRRRLLRSVGWRWKLSN